MDNDTIKRMVAAAIIVLSAVSQLSDILNKR